MTSLLGTKVALERLVKYLNQPEIEVETWDVSEPDVVCCSAHVRWPTAEGDPESALPFTLGELDFTLPLGKLTLVRGPVGAGKTLLVSTRASAAN